MKILHITKKYPEALGGDAIYVYNLESQQKKAGHNVFILTSNCPEILKKENVFKFGLKDSAPNQDKITILRIISLFILSFSCFKCLKKLKPDVIHSHSADLGFFSSIPARLLRIPVINTCHGVSFPDEQYNFTKRFAEKFFLKYGGFKKIITVDKSSLDFFKEAGISNTIYIPNGVDLERFDFKRIERKDNQKTRFLFVGRLEGEKGLKYLFYAVSRLKEENRSFEVLLVGSGSQEKKLLELAKELEIEEYVQFEGRVDMNHIIDFYHQSDIFLLPSIHEGLPLSLLEAWAAGLPVITTNVGGMAKICENEKNALIVTAKDSEALFDSMLRLIRDEELKRKLGENGRKLIEEKYSWDKITDKVISVYL